MQWVELRPRGETPHHAFEALCSVLFERWCDAEYAERLLDFYVTGVGGDGGVESIAHLSDGTAIGLQCKFFRDPLGSNQIAQISNSLNTAASLRKGLARYIVAVPRNLSDGVDAHGSTTERQRWSAFVANAANRHDKINIELWDDHRLESLMSQFGGEGLHRYWFAQATIEEDRLNRLYAQARAGWLKPRYSPELHQAGAIENEVELRANRRPLPSNWRDACRRQIYIASKVTIALSQLEHVTGVKDSDALATAKEAVGDLVVYLENLQTRLRAAATPNIDWDAKEPSLDLSQIIEHLSTLALEDMTRPQRDALDKLAQAWERREPIPDRLRQLQRPVMFIADAGAGKTHAAAQVVERALQRSEPALLIRARDFVPSHHSWTSILRQSLEEPDWSLEELFDALTAAARTADVRRAASNGGSETREPCRPIIIVDGLDESRGAPNWLTRLNELSASLGNRRIVFVVTCRTSLFPNRQALSSLCVRDSRQSDPDLESVFVAYIKASRIEVPPVVRWWLRTPLEIRLFADIFEGATSAAFKDAKLGIHELIRLKLQIVSEAAGDVLGIAAELARPFVTARLISIANTLLNRGGPITHQEILRCLRGDDGMVVAEPLSLLQILRDRGILLEIPSLQVDPLMDSGPSWDFAFETLHSYLLAASYMQQPSDCALTYLRQHQLALVFSIVLRENSGHDMLMSVAWTSGLSQHLIDAIRLNALSLMERSRALRYFEYVKVHLTASKMTCRAVVSILVEPGLRIEDYPYGAMFVLDTIADLKVADRDLFWSSPARLGETSEIWGGEGILAFEGEFAAKDDPWNTAPLLLLLSCATVVDAQRKRVVRNLSHWGAKQPLALPALLKEIFARVNDPQILEEAAAVAWAAACISPDARWDDLRSLILAANWKRAFPVIPTLRFVRYCELFLSLVNKQQTDISFDIPKILPINRSVGSVVEIEAGFGPIRGDFTWYVVPQAIDDFNRHENWGDEIADDQLHDESQWEKYGEETLRALATGKIRSDAPETARTEAQAILDEIDKRTRQERSDAREAASAKAQTIPDEIDEPEPERDESEGSVTSTADRSDNDDAEPSVQASDVSGKIRPSGLAMRRGLQDTPWRRELERVLALHSEQYALESFTLEALAYGYVMARVVDLGWDSNVAKADHAIREAHGYKTHGSRSSVCSFFEKYLWIALGELRTYLARSLSQSDPKGCLRPDRLEDVENPIDQLDFVSCHIPLMRWNKLLKPITLKEEWAQQRANEWIQQATPVSIRDAIMFHGENGRLHDHLDILMDDKGMSEWIALDGFVHLLEPESQAERLIWISSLLIEMEDIALLEDDARAGLFLGRHDLTDVSAGLARKGSYVGPFEALWMTDTELRVPVPHMSLMIDKGKLATCEVLMFPAVAEAKSKKRTFIYPVKALREQLAIRFYKNGCFFTGDRRLVAMRAAMESLAETEEERIWDPPTGHWLLVRKDSLRAQLKQYELGLLVAMREQTEPGGHLLQDRIIGWDRIEQRALVILTGDSDGTSIEEVKRSRGPLVR